MTTTTPSPLVDVLSGHVATLGAVIRLVGEHPTLRGRVSIDRTRACVGVDTVADFLAWADVMGAAEFTAWVAARGVTVLHLEATTNGTEIAVVGEHPGTVPGVGTDHTRLPLTALDPAAWEVAA